MTTRGRRYRNWSGLAPASRAGPRRRCARPPAKMSPTEAFGLLQDVEPERPRLRCSELRPDRGSSRRWRATSWPDGSPSAWPRLRSRNAKDRSAGPTDGRSKRAETSIDEPTGLRCGSLERKEEPPVDGPPGRQAPEPSQVCELVRQRTARKYRAAGHYAAEVVDASDLAVPQPERRGRELHRHVRRRLGAVERPADLRKSGVIHLVELREQLLADDPRQIVVDDDPLVMPADEALGLLEAHASGTEPASSTVRATALWKQRKTSWSCPMIVFSSLRGSPINATSCELRGRSSTPFRLGSTSIRMPAVSRTYYWNGSSAGPEP